MMLKKKKDYEKRRKRKKEGEEQKILIEEEEKECWKKCRKHIKKMKKEKSERRSHRKKSPISMLNVRLVRHLWSEINVCSLGSLLVAVQFAILYFSRKNHQTTNETPYVSHEIKNFLSSSPPTKVNTSVVMCES